MTEKTIKTYMDEINSKPPKKNYSTNKTNVYCIDNIWSLDIIDLKKYGPDNQRGLRYVLVVSNNFIKFDWTFALKKNGPPIKDSFEKILLTSKRNPKQN